MNADTLALPPAMRLLIAAAVAPATGAAVPMRSSDWQALPAVAHRHGLSALLNRVVLLRCGAPQEILDQLDDSTRRQALTALRGLAEVATLTAALAAAGVRCLTLKGPALSVWLYGEIACRRFSDLDLLISAGDRPTAYAVLHDLGYTLPPGMSTTTAGVIYRDLGAWPMSRVNALPLDLHWRLSHRRFPVALTADEVLGAATPLPLGHVVLNVPAPTHIAVLTLLHGAKHLWCTLEILLAIARLLRRDDVDWRLAALLLRRSHGWRGAMAGLTLASEMFGVPLVEELEVRPDAAVRQLRAAALEALQRPAGDFAGRRAERRAHHAALDRWTERLRYDAWRLFSPTPLEWEWCRLPDSLVALYTPLRIARLCVAALSPRDGGAADLITGTAVAQSAPDDAAIPSTRGGRESPRTSV